MKLLLAVLLTSVASQSPAQTVRHGLKAEEVVAKIKKGDQKLVFWVYSAKPYAYVLHTDVHRLGLWFIGEQTPLIVTYKPGGEEAGKGLPLWARQFFKGKWEDRQPFLLVGIYEDKSRKSEPENYEPVFYGYRKGGMVFPVACTEHPCISVDDAKPLLQQELNSLTAWTFHPDLAVNLK